MKKYISIVLAVIMIVLSCGLTTMAAGKKIVISCIGDSITNNSNNENYNYPKHLQTKLGGEYEVKNFGKSGAAVKSYTTTNEYANSLKSNPDIVIIMIGTNDSASWVSKEKYYNDYISLVNTYASLSSKPVIYLMSSPKAFESANWVDTFKNDIIEGDIRDTVMQIAEEKNLKFIDMYSATQNYSQYFYDGIHPNENGASLIAGTVSPVIIANKPDSDEKNNADVDIPELDPSEVITAVLNYDPMNNIYTVAGGFGQEKRGNITVGLRIFNESGSLIQTAVTTANRNKNGNVVFVFEPIVFFSDAQSGVYSFEISSFIGSKTFTSEYLSTLDGLELMLKLDRCSGDSYAQTIIDECSGTGADIEIFKNLSQSSKNTVVAKLSAIKSGLTSDTVNDPDCIEKVSTAISNFLKNYNYYTAIGVFNDSKTEAEVEAWIKKYADAYGFKTDDPKTSYSESDLWKYYVNVSKKVHEQLKNIYDAQTIEDIKSNVIEAILCSELDISHVSAVDQFLYDYAAAFSINLSVYNSLNNKDSVRSGIVNTGLYSYTAIKNKFDTLLSTALSAQNGSSGSNNNHSSNSGSNSGGVGTAASGFTGSTASTVQTQENPFNDLDGAEWAKESILALYKKNILNGKQADKFAPNDYITRAEFVKIIAVAFDLKVKEGKRFADVSKDAWYSEYVSAAADNGVVSGDDNGNFNPESLVARQDIAVMLYRVMKITAFAENSAFTDFADIAEYAKPAVGYFSATKVINGYPDGSFKPYGSATRAEAAKIISSILD